MAEKYWMSEGFAAEMDGLQEPLAIQERHEEIFADQPHITRVSIPEWWWVDADARELRVNVHQSYFDIADSGRTGGAFGSVKPEFATESRFVPYSESNSQWASLAVDLNQVFRRINDYNFYEIEDEASVVLAELNSIINIVHILRFKTQEPTPQLIAPYWGNVGLGGSLSGAARDYIKQQAGESQQAVHYRPASNVLHALGAKALGIDEFACGFGVENDGRFVSNTGLAMGTGSLMVLPEEVYRNARQDGYHYSSHNLETEFTQLWAFCGLAKLLGDAHRYYASETYKA